MNLSEINTNCIEGRLALAAMSTLSTTEGMKNKHPDECLEYVFNLQAEIYKDRPLPSIEQEPMTFEKELERLINRYSVENGSDTPDFILKDYLVGCIKNYNDTLKSRDNYFGVDMWAKNKIKNGNRQR